MRVNKVFIVIIIIVILPILNYSCGFKEIFFCDNDNKRTVKHKITDSVDVIIIYPNNNYLAVLYTRERHKNKFHLFVNVVNSDQKNVIKIANAIIDIKNENKIIPLVQIEKQMSVRYDSRIFIYNSLSELFNIICNDYSDTFDLIYPKEMKNYGFINLEYNIEILINEQKYVLYDKVKLYRRTENHSAWEMFKSF